MTQPPYLPEQVIPPSLADAVSALPYWFVIGGHAVRCLCPYRSSRDVDFGVTAPRNLEDLLKQLGRSGTTEILERTADTVHLRWNEIDVSIFVLPLFARHVEDRRLTVTGILATKLHAILDRGTRRDFFDLYVTLQRERLALVECLRAIRQVYQQDVNESLLLRALTFFDDADREPAFPGEASSDWQTVKDYFLSAVGALIVPPNIPLEIQKKRVDVHAPGDRTARRVRRSPRKRSRVARGR